MIITRSKELIRISPKDARKIEYSTNNGRTWNMRYPGIGAGTFRSITDAGKELLAETEKGLYYSTNEGRTWNRRS